MSTPRRHRLRRGSVALTRAEWILVGVAAMVGLVGFGLLFANLLLGGLLLACAGFVIGGTIALRGRFDSPSG